MDSALIVFSRQGLFTQTIKARDIPSREHARKLWPFIIAKDNPQLVTFVSPSFNRDGTLKQRSHFRTLSSSRSLNFAQVFKEEEDQRRLAASESIEHRTAKDLIAQELQQRVLQNKGLPWSFRDISASDFHFEGNLLLGAVEIAPEYTVQTPFGTCFRLDVAVLGTAIRSKPIILGGIEIERTHAFEGRKALLGKSLGFPLISIDISEMSIDEITPEWAARVLSQTTASSLNRRRQTYVYLHDLVYPLFVQIPKEIIEEQKHQYLIFADDSTLAKLVKWINSLAEILEYPKNSVTPSIVNGRSDAAKKTLHGAGEVVGPDWTMFNNQRCLRLTLPKSTGVTDLRAHKFHIALAYILLNHTNALVGYKYQNGIDNDNPQEDIWIEQKFESFNPLTFSKHRILPKRLAEPVEHLLSIINSLKTSQ